MILVLMCFSLLVWNPSGIVWLWIRSCSSIAALAGVSSDQPREYLLQRGVEQDLRDNSGADRSWLGRIARARDSQYLRWAPGPLASMAVGREESPGGPQRHTGWRWVCG